MGIQATEAEATEVEAGAEAGAAMEAGVEAEVVAMVVEATQVAVEATDTNPSLRLTNKASLL